MKNKLLAILAAFGMVSSASAVDINKNLSISGFIDGSYKNTDSDNAGLNTETLDLDEVELQFDTNVGNVSGSVHIDNKDGGADELNLEQAHFTYTLDNGISVKFGRFGSALGLEREDPAGLYTYSRAYENDARYDLGDIDTIGAVAGISLGYAAEVYSIAATFYENGDVDEKINTEISFSYTGFENLVIGGGYVIDNAPGGSRETDVLNLHASYTLGKLLLAGEIVSLDSQTAGAADEAFSILLDYDFTDKLGATVRVSEWEESATQEKTKFTIAPNYAITDSLGAILEYSDIDTGLSSTETDYLALELTYTF